VVLEGVILNRRTKKPASDYDCNTLLMAFIDVVEAQGFQLGGHLGCGFIFHTSDSMTTEHLNLFTLELTRILGGSFYFNGKLKIEDGEKLTLEEERFLRENLPPPEGGESGLN
jgi:hypothetical protein